jgi:hypothetical protein
LLALVFQSLHGIREAKNGPVVPMSVAADCDSRVCRRTRKLQTPLRRCFDQRAAAKPSVSGATPRDIGNDWPIKSRVAENNAGVLVCQGARSDYDLCIRINRQINRQTRLMVAGKEIYIPPKFFRLDSRRLRSWTDGTTEAAFSLQQNPRYL